MKKRRKKTEVKLMKALAVISRLVKDLNNSNKGYFNGNISKHRFLNEIQILAKFNNNDEKSREDFMNIATLILHHLENEWLNAGAWTDGADRVWNVVRTIDYPRGDSDASRI